MSEKKSVFICTNCGATSPKWCGQCHECEAWNSFSEEFKSKKAPLQKNTLNTNKAILVESISSKETRRLYSGIGEFDRVLGGGIMPGSLVLIGGEPGIGKSTLLTMVMNNLIRETKQIVLYVSGEESVEQIASRAKRLKIDAGTFYVLNETSWQKILHQIEKVKPMFIVIDSIQTTMSEDISAAAGTISQIRQVTFEILEFIKNKGINCFIVGHITKEGGIAGPKVLEHMVDTVLYFEGDRIGQYRIVRAMKNRFGDTNEVGIFEMKEQGLVEIKNPSNYFLNKSPTQNIGRSLTCILEGTRPIFVEIQALVTPNKFSNGKRSTQGIDLNRLNMLIAVIEKYLNIDLSSIDIYVNVAGGMKLTNGDSDLGILISIVSSYFNKELPQKTIFLGEIGLTGEVGAVSQIERRLIEMKHLKFKKAYIGDYLGTEVGKTNYPFDIKRFKNVKEAVDLVL